MCNVCGLLLRSRVYVRSLVEPSCIVFVASFAGWKVCALAHTRALQGALVEAGEKVCITRLAGSAHALYT